MSYNTAPDTIVRRHPIRGLLWGALLGIGIALHLLTFELVAFGTWPLLAAPIGGGIVVGFTWGKFGPVKKLKGRIPAALRGSSVHDESPQARRAAQLAAARKAQSDLQAYARENADEAMCAALREAQTDVLDSVTRRVGRVPAARLATTNTQSPIAATKPEPVATTLVEPHNDASESEPQPAPIAAAEREPAATTDTREPTAATEQEPPASTDTPKPTAATEQEPPASTDTPTTTATEQEPVATSVVEEHNLAPESEPQPAATETEPPATSVVEEHNLAPESEPQPAATAAAEPNSAIPQADPVLEQLADHPAAQLGGFDHDLAAEAAALAAQFEQAWETAL